MRDRIGIDFNTNAEAISHCGVIAQEFRNNSLRDDQNLEISVVNDLGREIHREFVHRDNHRLNYARSATNHACFVRKRKQFHQDSNIAYSTGGSAVALTR